MKEKIYHRQCLTRHWVLSCSQAIRRGGRLGLCQGEVRLGQAGRRRSPSWHLRNGMFIPTPVESPSTVGRGQGNTSDSPPTTLPDSLTIRTLA